MTPVADALPDDAKALKPGVYRRAPARRSDLLRPSQIAFAAINLTSETNGRAGDRTETSATLFPEQPASGGSQLMARRQGWAEE